MIPTMKITWQCLFSPRLYKIYRDGPMDTMYQPQGMEKWGDKIISSANTMLNIGLYTSPFICLYVYRRGFFSLDETKSLARFFGSVGCILAISLFMRAYGRATNAKYVQFLKALTASANDKVAYLDGVRKYDFDFSAWPVSYNISSKSSSSWLQTHPFSVSANENLPLYQRATIQLLAFIATHTFALRLIYPGSLGLVHNLLWTPLFQGRVHIVESFNGQRAKLKTADDNTLDTMFVDNRNKSLKGSTLVVCCEGNSGFYEVGIMMTPVRAGYSALGWNHPGFAGSTGLPYPSQEHNGIDAVMQYAINELKFKPEDVVLFGWSIGGYSAAWAANNYPVKALVLDATFDDLLPLAQNQMPASWSLLVKEVVRSHVDLHVAQMLKKYDGPVHLVRRTEDEIICLTPGDLSTNRGNHLIIELISYRHPDVANNSLEVIEKYVHMPATKRPTVDSKSLDDTERRVLRLITRYMRDYRSSHCTPLPDDHFQSIMDNITSNSDKSD